MKRTSSARIGVALAVAITGEASAQARPDKSPVAVPAVAPVEGEDDGIQTFPEVRKAKSRVRMPLSDALDEVRPAVKACMTEAAVDKACGRALAEDIADIFRVSAGDRRRVRTYMTQATSVGTLGYVGAVALKAGEATQTPWGLAALLFATGDSVLGNREFQNIAELGAQSATLIGERYAEYEGLSTAFDRAWLRSTLAKREADGSIDHCQTLQGVWTGLIPIKDVPAEKLVDGDGKAPQNAAADGAAAIDVQPIPTSTSKPLTTKSMKAQPQARAQEEARTAEMIRAADRQVHAIYGPELQQLYDQCRRVDRLRDALILFRADLSDGSGKHEATLGNKLQAYDLGRLIDAIERVRNAARASPRDAMSNVLTVPTQVVAGALNPDKLEFKGRLPGTVPVFQMSRMGLDEAPSYKSDLSPVQPLRLAIRQAGPSEAYINQYARQDAIRMNAFLASVLRAKNSELDELNALGSIARALVSSERRNLLQYDVTGVFVQRAEPSA